VIAFGVKECMGLEVRYFVIHFKNLHTFHLWDLMKEQFLFGFDYLRVILKK
jgi:hypothetical protein